MEDHDHRSDEDLLRAVADSDTSALRVLYDRHAPWISVRLARRCNDQGLIAEVLQDTFVATWKGAGSFKGDGEVAAWLWGIAIRRLVSRLRKHDLNELPTAELITANEISVEERVLQGVEYGDLGLALQKLSPEMRAVVQATVLDGLTTREASRLLGVHQATVKTRLHRAKAQLRRDLLEAPA